ncbi:MAG: hypothetical protein HPY76_05455 [Anaerolineae bacterium]|nr:hypothetical protein [Anaerolineae bacterium]
MDASSRRAGALAGIEPGKTPAACGAGIISNAVTHCYAEQVRRRQFAFTRRVTGVRGAAHATRLGDRMIRISGWFTTTSNTLIEVIEIWANAERHDQ